jgi:(4-alkanoyl-5-oxo-2,5-dihydrofuran-3-yl)methyl phosphate reductase
MRYLITGATGNIGSLVVERLLARAERPRLLARDASAARVRSQYGDRVEVVTGDLAHADSLAAACRDIDRLFLVTSGPQLATLDALAAQVARASGVGHIVKLSTIDVYHQNVGTGVWHAQGEAAIRASGIGYTFVQPSGFMSNALAWASAIRSQGLVCSSAADGRIAVIHPHDIADTAVAALTGTSLDGQGQELPITGPQALSYAQMLAMIGGEIGRSLVFQSISDDEERSRWQARGESLESIEYHLSIFRAIRAGTLAGVTDTVARVLGHEPRRFAQWVRENAAAFR